MQVPLYALEGMGQMKLAEAIEDQMIRKLRENLDAKGITKAGVRLPDISDEALDGLGDIEGFGEVGDLGRRRLFKRRKKRRSRGVFKGLMKKLRLKQRAKASKARRKMSALVKALKKTKKKKAAIAISPPRHHLTKVKSIKLNLEEKAIKRIAQATRAEAIAPKVTQDDVVEAMKPSIKAAAKAMATGTKAAVSQKAEQVKTRAIQGKINWFERIFGRWGRGKRRAPSAMETSMRYGKGGGRRGFFGLGQALKTGETDDSWFKDTPANAFEEMMSSDQDQDVSGFGTAGYDIDTAADAFSGLDVDNGADAFGYDVERGKSAFGPQSVDADIDTFGQLDIESGADAFGQLDVESGADAFGQLDVESGADAFGQLDVENGADAFGAAPKALARPAFIERSGLTRSFPPGDYEGSAFDVDPLASWDIEDAVEMPRVPKRVKRRPVRTFRYGLL